MDLLKGPIFIPYVIFKNLKTTSGRHYFEWVMVVVHVLRSSCFAKNLRHISGKYTDRFKVAEEENE
jgi:hypothetical protein